MAARCDENVGGLYVPMNDALGVRRIQCVGHLNCKIKESFDGERSSLNAVLQRLAVQKLHRDEGLSPAFADLIDGTNSGMIQGRSSASLATKPFQCLRFPGQIYGQKFQGDGPAKSKVLSFINNA